MSVTRVPCRMVAVIALAMLPLAAQAHVPDAASPALQWEFDPWIVASLLASSTLYALGIYRLWSCSRHGAGVPVWRAGCFFAGLCVVVAALVSPLDALGAQLFSMHMLQHELLMLIAAPLLVAGSPLAVFLWAFAQASRRRIGQLARASVVRSAWHALTLPLVAWVLHAAVLWIWHAPRLFQASLVNDTVHALQHAAFLLSALLFWSSLSGTVRAGPALVYILTTAIHSGMLGALLTFSPGAWYPVYAGRTEVWGLSLLEDQQLGGLIMWVPAGFVLLGAGLAFAAKVIHPGGGVRPAWK